MYFEFALELSDIDLWIIDLSDTRLDLLETDIPVKVLFCLHNVFNISSRHVFKTSSTDVFKTCLQDMSSRRLKDVFSVTIFRLPRRLQDMLEDVKLLRWRRVEDVFKTCHENFLKTSSGPANVWWKNFDEHMKTFITGND